MGRTYDSTFARRRLPGASLLFRSDLPPDAPEQVLVRWNSTQIYSRIGGTWKIIHSHWSFLP
jgi:hypothetical protein